MKKLNEVEVLQKTISKENRIATIQTLLESSLNGFERLMESNASEVESVLAYNTVAGLVSQLKYWSAAAFRGPESGLDPNMHSVPESSSEKLLKELQKIQDEQNKLFGI